MDFDLTEYNRIASMTNSREIAKELQAKSLEWKEQYYKLKRKTRNDAYNAHAKDTNNAKRRDLRKLKNENIIKPIETIKTTINPDDVDTDIKRSYKDATNIAKLNPNTINNYISVIKAVFNKYHKEPLADDAEVLKLLRNEKYEPKKLLKQNMYIVDNIRDIASNHSYQLSILYSIFSRLNGKNLKILRETIYPYSVEYKKVYTENRDNAVANTEITSKISFDKNEVLKNAELIEDDYEKLMYMLLFLIPTRRLYDYRITRIATKKKDTENEMFNWYYQGNIHINNTKNKDKMILQLPTEIIAIINKLPTDTDYIFGKAYIESTLSRKFSNITNRIYNSQFTPLDIRRLFATHSLNTTNDNGDVNNLFKNAKNMGHSLNQHLQYVKKPKI